MNTETALPGAEQATAGQSEQTPEQIAATAALTEKNRAIDQADDTPEGEQKPKPEKTPEQREIDRLRRGIDRKTRQLAEARAASGLTREPIARNNQQSADDSEPLSLTRAQLQEMVNAEAAKLAPTLRQQAAEVERRTSVVQSLAKTWGQERFDEVSSDLDDAFGGLADSSGKPKPAIEAVFEADEPARVIEWLADPDNADEADRISKMSAAQAGKAIAKLEARLSADPNAKPKASKAPEPLEKVRGHGKSEKSLADLSGKDFDERRRKQIAQRYQ